MRVSTWNVNSVRMRLPRLLRWLEQRSPDVVCLQETKVGDDEFPADPIRGLGYECVFHGEKKYNGVAILTRLQVSDPIRILPGDDSDSDCRFISAAIAGIRIINIYAPNGREVGSESYGYKLNWYRRLRSYLDAAVNPDSEVLLCGDLNVAPEDRDVWDPELWRGKILFSEPEKEAFRSLIEWGFTDALRMRHPEEGLYTWWDYRMGAFHRGWGMRIDHILLSAPLARRCADVEIERSERKGEKPSDHAPVSATLE